MQKFTEDELTYLLESFRISRVQRGKELIESLTSTFDENAKEHLVCFLITVGMDRLLDREVPFVSQAVDALFRIYNREECVAYLKEFVTRKAAEADVLVAEGRRAEAWLTALEYELPTLGVVTNPRDMALILQDIFSAIDALLKVEEGGKNE